MCLAAIGLALLFAACERDALEGAGDGKKVEILLSANITNYQTGGDMVRSGGVREAMSVIIPLNNEFHLRATLMPDSEGGTAFGGSQLRDAEAFMDGPKLCFAAFKPDGSGQVGATAVYTYSSDRGEWMSSAPLMVVPDDVTEYRFVAYSYFESTATPSVTGIDPVYDLVWGKSENKKIVGEAVADRTVSIQMKHKFSRVKVRVRSSKIATAKITVLSGVEVAGGKLASLDPFSGDIALGNAVAQEVDITAPDPAVDDIESLYRTVTPVGSGTVSVKLGTLKVSTASSTTFYNKWAAFDGTLDEAESYTLVVDLKKGLGFAFSNIYWDGGKLTFDTADKGHQGYQGVFFKWGSLVGISPAGAFPGSTDIYVPVVNSILSNSTWDPTTCNARNWTSWGENTYTSADIPYLDPSFNGYGTVAFGRNNRYAIDADRNDPTTMWAKYRGDICQYLSATGAVIGNYRLPTSAELGPATGWTMGSAEEDNSLGNAGGTVDLLNATNNRAWAKNSTLGDVVFPASGYRIYNAGTVYRVGRNGDYWSGSADSATDGYNMFFNINDMSPYGVRARSYAFPIRCVQD
jgi:hypothetical protein